MSEIDKASMIDFLVKNITHDYEKKDHDYEKELKIKDIKELRELISVILSKKKQASPAELRRLYEAYKIKYDFCEGDLVQWKKGMKDRRLPNEEEPAVILRILDEPVYDHTQDGGSQYFNEPFDMVLGVLGSDGKFATYHFNSQRFEPYKASNE